MLRKIAGACGITSQIVAFAAVFIAISYSPWFSWTEHNISILGIEGRTTALFNSGLILAGLLSLMFAIGLKQSLLSSRLGRLGATSLMLGSVALAGIGIFPRTLDLPHDLSSVLFFVFITIALLLVGAAATAASQMRWGTLSLMAGILIIIFRLVPWPWSGGTIPQLLFCLPWSLWTVILGGELLVKTNPVNI